MIYVNGDSHSAGADIIPGVCFAQDDPRYLAYGRRAHPEAVLQTYGYHIAQAMNQGFFCEAESGSSNDRILRTTKKYVDETKDKNTIGFIIIGWTSWEREEWKHGEDFVQISAGGTDSVLESMEEEYKEWVLKQTPEEHKHKEQLWYDRIWNFHCELKEQNIRHIFFNTTQNFNDNRDWNINFIPIPFCEWAAKQGFRTIENSNHYGADAHRAWGKYLTSVAVKHYQAAGFGDNAKHLTQPERRSIITQVKQEFKGLRN